MKRFALLVAALLFAISLSGCATVNRGITDYFRIDSVPQGAKATTTIETYDSKQARIKNPELKPVYHSCEPTPCAIPLYRRSEFVVTLEQEGYETAEMFITNSSSSGSFTANMAASTATTTGTMAAGAAVGAAFATTASAVSATVVGGTLGAGASIYTFGLIPAETAISTGISFVTSSAPTYSSSAAAGSAIPPALIVTGGMLLTDAVTGANVNLYPNPVVLKMAPAGVAMKIDPNVEPFKRELSLKDDIEQNCEDSQKSKETKRLCSDLRAQLSTLRAEKKAAKKAAREKYRAAQKQSKEKARGETKP